MPTKASRTHTTTSAMVVVASIRVFTLLRMWKSLRMFSSWLCVCVCVSACLGESFHFFLDFLFFFFLARAETEMCNSSFPPSPGDG